MPWEYLFSATGIKTLVRGNGTLGGDRGMKPETMEYNNPKLNPRLLYEDIFQSFFMLGLKYIESKKKGFALLCWSFI